MIFKRKDPSEERRKRIKNASKDAALGSVFGAGAGLIYARNKYVLNPKFKKESILHKARTRHEDRVSNVNSIKTQFDNYKKRLKDRGFELRQSDIDMYKKDIVKHKQRMKETSKAVRSAKSSIKNLPGLFGKGNRSKTLKSLGTGIAAGTITGVATGATIRPIVHSVRDRLHKRRKEKEYAAMSHSQRVKAKLRSAIYR